MLKRLLIISIPFLGFLSVFLPIAIFKDLTIFSSSTTVFDVFRFLVEEMEVLTIGILFLMGNIFGYLLPKSWWIIGPLFIVLFPLVASVEIILNPKTHNLWVFEFIFYGFMALVSTAGTFFGSRFSN